MLDLVTTEDTGGLFIIPNGEYSSLVYKKQGTDEIVTVSEGKLGNRFRPIHCSELTNFLKYHSWCRGGTLVVGEEGDIYYTSPRTDGSLAGERIPLEQIEKTQNPITPSGSDDDYDKKINDWYGDIFGTESRAYEENNFFSTGYNPVGIRGTESSVLDLIEYNSDTYTSILNLSPLVSGDVSGIVSGNVQYSIGDLIYTQSFMFSADPTTTYISPADSMIVIEYVSGVLRVFPVDRRIGECIINDCILVYCYI